MRRLLPSAFLLLLAGLVAMPAAAQSPICGRIEAELAALDRGADARGRSDRLERTAERYRREASRTAAQMRRMGCDQQQFLFFGSPPPAACGPMQARLDQLAAAARSYDAAADRGYSTSNERRRDELHAALSTYGCRTFELPERPGVFEALSEGVRGPYRQLEIRPDDEIDDDEPAPLSQRRRPAGNPLCVRTCDGYFFPLNSVLGRADDPDQICQALCPASETRAFFTRSGEIEQAVGMDGRNYTELPNALRYRKNFDAGCSCRKAGQGWSEALRPAEDQLARRTPPSESSPDESPDEASDTTARVRAFLRRADPATTPVPAVPAQPLPRTEAAPEAATEPQQVRRPVRVIAPELGGVPPAARAP